MIPLTVKMRKALLEYSKGLPGALSGAEYAALGCNVAFSGYSSGIISFRLLVDNKRCNVNFALANYKVGGDFANAVPGPNASMNRPFFIASLART